MGVYKRIFLMSLICVITLSRAGNLKGQKSKKEDREILP